MSKSGLTAEYGPINTGNFIYVISLMIKPNGVYSLPKAVFILVQFKHVYFNSIMKIFLIGRIHPFKMQVQFFDNNRYFNCYIYMNFYQTDVCKNPNDYFTFCCYISFLDICKQSLYTVLLIN